MSLDSDPRFPDPQPGPSARRLALRLGCTALLSALLLVQFRGLVATAIPLLWPPADPISRWLGLVTVLVGSFFVLPGVVGSLVADFVYDRYLETDR